MKKLLAITAITIVSAFAIFGGVKTMYAEIVEPVKNVTKGTHYSTIQLAINDANPGDVIEVGAGTYNESINIDKSITLKGSQYNVDPRPSAGSSRSADGSNESIVVAAKNQKVFNIAANDVNINGFVVKQDGGSGTSDAIKASGSQANITIEDNIVVNVTDEAIQLESGNNYLVKNNYILNPFGDGITFSSYTSATNPIKGINQSIIGNDISGSLSAYGSIYLYGTQNVTIDHNIITTRGTGVAVGSEGLDVKNVIITNNTINTELGKVVAVVNAIGIDGNSTNIEIKNNNIKQIGDTTPVSTYGLIRIGIAASSNPSDVVINYNNLSKLVQENYVYVNPGVTNPVDLTKNWWGSNTNPEAKINNASQVVVTFIPWLCQPFEQGSLVSINGECTEVVQVIPPTVIINNPAENSTTSTVLNDNKLHITGKFTDDVAPNHIQFQLVRAGNSVTTGIVYGQDITNPDGSFTYDMQVPIDLADGQYSLFYTGTDFDGGSTARMERIFNIDNTNQLPKLTVDIPAEGSTVSTVTNGNRLNVTGTFTDDRAPNYAQFQLVYKGNSVTLGTMYGYGSVYNPNATYANEDGTYTFDLAVPSNLENGEYSLFYTGTDFENGITQRMERKFNINNSLLAPTGLKWMVGSTAIACGGTTNATITSPTWNAVSGASSYNYQFMSPGNSVWQDGGNYTNTTTGPTSFGTLDGVEGVWKFRVQTVDANGALSEWSEGCPVTFSKTNGNNTLDTTAPVVSITNPVEGSKANTDVEIRGSVVDDNPHHYWLNITRNGSIIYNKTVLEDKSFEDKLLYTATLEGEYVVTLAARDAVGGTATSGNRSENVVVKFTIDKSASTTPNEGGNTTPVIQSITSGGGGLIFSPSFYNSTPANPTITPPTTGRVLGATVYQFTQDMKLGSVGPEVKALQKFLNAKGFIVSETGAGSKGNETEYFGLKTKLALIKYQKANDVILQRVEIFNNEGTGNFFWSTKQSANEMLSTDSETSTLLSQ